MHEARGPGAPRHHDIIAGVLVAVVVAGGIAAVTLAALPATRVVPEHLRSSAWTAVTFVVIEVAFAGTGALLVHRRAGGPIGWLLLAFALVDGVNRAGEYWSATALHARPGSLPAGYGMAWLDSVSEGVALVLLAVVVLLFPTGRPPPGRWHWALALVTGGALLAALTRAMRPGDLEGVSVTADNPFGVGTSEAMFDLLRLAGLLGVSAGVVGCAASLLPRWRAADGTGRLQLKWLASVSLLFVILVPIVSVLPEPFTILQAAALAAFPIAVGIAILEFRLDTIDLLLRRAAAGVLLAVALVAFYMALVVAATAVVGRPGDPFLVVLAAVVTLVLAPRATEAAQHLADRLVLGPRAKPYEVLVELTASVANSVAGEDVLERMARVVAEGVGAASAEVWLDDGTGVRRAATWPPPAPGPAAPTPSGYIYAVAHDGRPLGVIAVQLPRGVRLRPSDEDLLQHLASGSALVLENARLIAELRASRQRLVTAQDSERRRIERDLHDGAQQRLVALGIELRRARQRLGQLDPCQLGDLLDRSAGDVQEAVDELRELARGIHPAVLTTGGLGPALQSLADRSPVPVVTRLDVDGAAPATVAATAYFVTAEALANAARHADASQVELSGAVDGGRLVVSIRDDGLGGATSVAGGGLQGLADRVAAVGGTLAVDSPVGEGTTIRMEVPCGSS